MEIDNLEFEFLNGCCASLAKAFNRTYGYEIFHIFEFSDDSDEDGIIHTLIRIDESRSRDCVSEHGDEDRYLDVSGIYSGYDLIKKWYRNRCATIQMTKIFIIDDVLKSKFCLENGKLVQSCITMDNEKIYRFHHYLSEVNYVYTGKLSLDEVCKLILDRYGLKK